MREFRIACAGSRKAARWANQKTTWPDLCEKLRKTAYTSETVEEYWAMSKDERDAAKDKGGFVGGYLAGGRRKIVNVKLRSLITHDVDTPDMDFYEKFVGTFPYAAVIYATHSYRPESPRYRVVIALAEDIPPDHYAAVSRYLAADYGIEQYDPVSFVTNQLMHWPSTSKGGEYICTVIEGPFLDADAYLSEHPGWEDYSNLPVSSREKKRRNRDGMMQEDPLTKKGIVGAFCRAYSIEDAISKFLSDVYAPSATEGRYDYIPGEGSCGVVTYNGVFSYSHHATDPAGEKTLNAFDLVRVHRFGGEDEKASFLKMVEFAQEDPLVREELEKERLEEAKKDFEEISSGWEEPIPFGKYELEPFPIDALPNDIGEYAAAVSENTQTPVDMAGTACLAFVAVCIQGKYAIEGKPGWVEPMNIFSNIIASPSERKSAVLHAVVLPGDNYEVQYNFQNAPVVEGSKMRRRVLERRQRAIEEQVAKGKAEPGDLDQIAREIAEFEDVRPLQLYVDDITTEKLVSVMAGNRGRAALISSEGGIFDTLAGIYTRNVNIDVMLKGYSGDTIRVDRIGRESENIMNPSLTILLMTQPKVVSDVLGNATFRGRGLTARFLYCLPTSTVGNRRFQSKPVPDVVYQNYEQKIVNMLEEEYPPRPEVITLSKEASELLTAFAEEIEPKMKTDYTEIADWAGKLVGNTLRIAGLLCRASVYRVEEFLTENDPLVVNGETMKNAIRLGKYYLSHALAVYDAIPESAMYKQADKILKMIQERDLSQFSRRDAMRYCQTFKRVDEIQPVLDFLEDYCYIASMDKSPSYGKGRPVLPKYVVNPAVLS
ncbi:MAG: DUF3987 domain-containing protein [Lachnospiraceae bacterium]|nr:DUF3987 domain-containing protein [Lachnospiraceae bacterium]